VLGLPAFVALVILLVSLIYYNYNFMQLSYVRTQWVVLSILLVHLARH
jgi:hypothetical protein